MADLTDTYEFNLPIVGGDVNTWGGFLNENWELVDDLLDGTEPISGNAEFSGNPVFSGIPVVSGSVNANLRFVDTAGTTDNNKFQIQHTALTTSFLTLDDTDSTVATDYVLTRNSSGAVSHSFYYQGSIAFEVSNDIDFRNNDIDNLENITFDPAGGTSNINLGSTDELRFLVGGSLLAQIDSSGLSINGGDALTFLSGGDANINVAAGQELSVKIDGNERFRLTEDLWQLKNAGGTVVAQIPAQTTGGDVFGVQAAYDETTAGGANLNVNSSGNIRRSTSSGAYKIKREAISNRVKKIGDPKEQDVGSVIDNLNPVSFESTHKLDNKARFTGFIAEDVLNHYPEASMDGGENYDVRALLALLWVEVQELRKRLNAHPTSRE